MASDWLDNCENFTPTPEKNDQYAYVQAASQSTFINAQLHSTCD
jgi:hypothetical protein